MKDANDDGRSLAPLLPDKAGYQRLQIMEFDLGVRFTEAFQTIYAYFADQEVARKLAVTPGSPVLFVERIMNSHKRQPVELVQTSYRGDMYKYIVRLKTIRGEWMVSGFRCQRPEPLPDT